MLLLSIYPGQDDRKLPRNGMNRSQKPIRDFSSSLPDTTFSCGKWSTYTLIRRCCPLQFPFIGPLSPTDGESPRPTPMPRERDSRKKERGPWWCLARVCGGHEITEVERERQSREKLESDGKRYAEKEKGSRRKNHGHGVDRALNPDPTGVLRRSTASLQIVSSTLLGLPHYQPCFVSTLSFILRQQRSYHFSILSVPGQFRTRRKSNLKDIKKLRKGSRWPWCAFRGSLKMFTNSIPTSLRCLSSELTVNVYERFIEEIYTMRSTMQLSFFRVNN